jgi:tyrosine-protein phosphatase
MHYLKLQWSHGQKDLVTDGFQAGIVFSDAALARGDGVLIQSVLSPLSPLSCLTLFSSCQCGISRSATMVIALVMRAAALCSPSVPPEVWSLKGMQAAYAYVKEKSKWIGPNMSYVLSKSIHPLTNAPLSLIYELLDYEKKLGADFASPTPSDAGSAVTSEEETWSRQRQLLDEMPSDTEGSERDSFLVMQEARALDKAMENRIVARKSSASSIASTSSGFGMGPAWRSRYSTRKRAGSIASNMTNNSIISENLVEEEEEPELLGVGGGFDDSRERRRSADTFDSSATNSPDDEVEATPRNLFPSPFAPRLAPHLRPPPSAPAWKQTFDIPHIPPTPLTAVRSTFKLPPKLKPKTRRRPPPIGLPPVPSSPVTLVVDDQDPPVVQSRPEPTIPPAPLSPSSHPHSPTQSLPNAIETPQRPPASHRPASLPKQGLRQRAEARRPSLPPQHLRKISIRESSAAPSAATPHQTLFVFPPSPTLTMRTPSAVLLTTRPAEVSTPRNGMVPFPSISTPKISTFKHHGRTKSFIGIGTPMTPTTAFTKAEARGYFGLE